MPGAGTTHGQDRAQTEPVSRARLAWWVSLTGYFSLLVLMLAWNTVLAPSQYFPVAIVLIVMVVPLLIPLRGLLHARPYTHAWTAFLSLLYFTHGVVEATVNPEQRLLGLLEIAFSLLLFFGTTMYARYASTDT